MDGMKAVRLPRDRPHRIRVPQDRVRRQRHRSREPGYPRKPNLPGIQEIAWLVRDPCPQQSASSDPPANHSRDSHETRRFYTVWVKLGRAGDVRCTTALPPKADVHLRSCYVAFGRVEDGRGRGHAATLRFPSPLIEPDVPISGIRLVWGFLCQAASTPFLSCFVIPFFCSTRAASILSTRARDLGHPFVTWVGDDPEQFLDTIASDRCDDPELGKM